MNGYVLNDAGAFPSPVKTNTGVTVWGKRGAQWSICFAPVFDVVAWVPNPKIVCTQR